MRETICLEIAEREIVEYPRKMGVFALPPRYGLVVNSPLAVTRIVPIENLRTRMTAAYRWGLVKDAFPLGAALNENTHLFDGCMYYGARNAVFLMAALPIAESEAAWEAGAAHVGNGKKITRLETAEAVLFRRVCAQGQHSGTSWVMYPCGTGVKALIITQGLPRGVHFLSLDEAVRENALHRALMAYVPSEVTMLMRDDWGAQWQHARAWLADYFDETSIPWAEGLFPD